MLGVLKAYCLSDSAFHSLWRVASLHLWLFLYCNEFKVNILLIFAYLIDKLLFSVSAEQTISTIYKAEMDLYWLWLSVFLVDSNI